MRIRGYFSMWMIAAAIFFAGISVSPIAPGSFDLSRVYASHHVTYKFWPKAFKKAVKVKVTDKQLKGLEKFFELIIENRHSLYLEAVANSQKPVYQNLVRHNPELKKYRRNAERVGKVALSPHFLGNAIMQAAKRLKLVKKK